MPRRIRTSPKASSSRDADAEPASEKEDDVVFLKKQLKMANDKIAAHERIIQHLQRTVEDLKSQLPSNESKTKPRSRKYHGGTNKQGTAQKWHPKGNESKRVYCWRQKPGAMNEGGHGEELDETSDGRDHESSASTGLRDDRDDDAIVDDSLLATGVETVDQSELTLDCGLGLERMAAILNRVGQDPLIEKLTIKPSSSPTSTSGSTRTSPRVIASQLKLDQFMAMEIANVFCAQPFSGLRILNLGQNKILDSGVLDIIGSLGHIKTLEAVNFSGNQLKDEGGIAAVKFAVSNGGLQQLDLSWNSISEAAGKAIEEVLKEYATHKLYSLDLTSNYIREKRLASIQKYLCEPPKGSRDNMETSILRSGRRKTISKREVASILKRKLKPFFDRVQENKQVMDALNSIPEGNSEAYRDCVRSVVTIDSIIEGIDKYHYSDQSDIIEALTLCVSDRLSFYKSQTKMHNQVLSAAEFLESELFEIIDEDYLTLKRVKILSDGDIVRRQLFLMAGREDTKIFHLEKRLQQSMLQQVARCPYSTTLLHHFAWRLLNSLRGYPKAWAFIAPVDPYELGIPDYHEVVKTPIALEDIRERLNNDEYNTLDELVLDVERIFENAISYNNRKTPTHKDAKICWAYFAEQIRKLIPPSFLSISASALEPKEIQTRKYLYVRSREPPFEAKKQAIRRLARKPFVLFERLKKAEAANISLQGKGSEVKLKRKSLIVEAQRHPDVLDQIVRLKRDNPETENNSKTHSQERIIGSTNVNNSSGDIKVNKTVADGEIHADGIANPERIEFWYVHSFNALTLGCVLRPLFKTGVFGPGTRYKGKDQWELVNPERNLDSDNEFYNEVDVSVYPSSRHSSKSLWVTCALSEIEVVSSVKLKIPKNNREDEGMRRPYFQHQRPNAKASDNIAAWVILEEDEAKVFRATRGGTSRLPSASTVPYNRARTMASGSMARNFWSKSNKKGPPVVVGAAYVCPMCELTNPKRERACRRCWTKNPIFSIPADEHKKSTSNFIGSSSGRLESPKSLERKEEENVDIGAAAHDIGDDQEDEENDPKSGQSKTSRRNKGAKGNGKRSTMQVKPVVERRRKRTSPVPSSPSKRSGSGTRRRKKQKKNGKKEINSQRPRKSRNQGSALVNTNTYIENAMGAGEKIPDLKDGDIISVTWSDEGTFECILQIRKDNTMAVKSKDGKFKDSIPFDWRKDEWEFRLCSGDIARPLSMSSPQSKRRKSASKSNRQRKMSYNEKQKLFEEIHKLPQEKLAKVIDIVSKHDQMDLKEVEGSEKAQPEVTIDIAKLSSRCLFALQGLVEEYQKEEGKAGPLIPKVGMQVNVWFEDPPDWFTGTIENCKRIRSKNHAKGEAWRLDILYDDGERESTDYPDNDNHVILRNIIASTTKE